MDVSRQDKYRRQQAKDSFDRRVDQWIETGRQFVDGVAGTRPGKRRSINVDRRSSSSLESVGRWVGDKIDWFLEDEDDWVEPWQSDTKETNLVKKKPLDAISRRSPKEISSRTELNQTSASSDDWPQDSDYRVDKWQRPQPDQRLNNDPISKRSRKSNSSDRRPLPRSSRRRF